MLYPFTTGMQRAIVLRELRNGKIPEDINKNENSAEIEIISNVFAGLLTSAPQPGP
jgi:hypothetical protein